MKTKILSQITDRMTETNIGKAKLSKIIGIDRVTLWRYLNGKTDINLEVLVNICEVLEIKITLEKSKPLFDCEFFEKGLTD